MTLADDLNDYLANTMAGQKRCSKCGGVKAIDRFYRNHQNHDGRSGSCKVCCDKYQAENKAQRDLNRAKLRAKTNARKREQRAALDADAKTVLCSREREKLRRWRTLNPERNREHSTKPARELSDSYLRIGLGLRKAECAPELLPLKREAIATFRVLKQLKEAIHERLELDDVR